MLALRLIPLMQRQAIKSVVIFVASSAQILRVMIFCDQRQ